MVSDICWAAGPKAVEAKWPEIFSTEFVLCFLYAFPALPSKNTKKQKNTIHITKNTKNPIHTTKKAKKTIDTKKQIFRGDFRTVEMVS
jgi:hypothetical protein